MQRREFIAMLAAAAAAGAATRPAAAQQSVPVVGFLNGQSAEPMARFVAAFKEGLKSAGYVEGENVAIEYRFAQGKPDLLPDLAADLVRRGVTVISASGGNAAALAAKAATSSIPIVFSVNDDPVRAGLVKRLNRPGGNLTGVSWLATELASKALALINELLPAGGAIALLADPSNPDSAALQGAIVGTARGLGRKLIVLRATTPQEIEQAFASLAEQRARAVIVASGPFFASRREQLIALAAQHRVPAIYPDRESAAAGGLMSYGTDLPDAYRRNGAYVGRILKGDKPATLKVDRPTHFDLVINLKTAKALGIDVPALILGRADEVIR